MGFFDSVGGVLFGEKPSVLQEQKITPTSKFSPAQEKLFNEKLAPFFQGENLAQLGPQGPFEAGLTGERGLEMASLSALEDFVSGAASGRAQNLFGPQGRSGVGGAVQQGPGDLNKFFDEAIQNPALRSFQEDVLPAISRKAAGKGTFFGTERRNSDIRAREDLLQSLTQQRAQTNLTERRSDLDRNLSAFSAFPQAVTSALQGGAISRGAADESVKFDFQKFVNKQGRQDTRVQQILAALGLSAQENIVTAPIIDQGREGIASDLISVAAAFAGKPG